MQLLYVWPTTFHGVVSHLLTLNVYIVVLCRQSAALKQALRAHKQATTVNSHQSEWRQEHTRLTVSRQHAEAELQSIVQQLTASAYCQHFQSTHTKIHQLAKDLTWLMDERRHAEQSRDEWADQMHQPRERARAMMAEMRSKEVKVERETRLMAAKRQEERTTLCNSLHQLMRGLRHQSHVSGEELEQQRSRAEAELANYSNDWLALMSDVRIEDDANNPDALLVVDSCWLATLPSERRDEVEAARRQWSVRWVERREMMDRLFAHKREYARQQLDEHVAALRRFGGDYDALLTDEQIDDEKHTTPTPPNPVLSSSAPTTPATFKSRASTKRVTKTAAISTNRTIRHPWNACDQRLLLHILVQYTAAGKQRKQTLDRFVLEFKHVTTDELKLRLDCAIQQRLCSEQLRSIEADVRTARWELDEEVESGWSAEVGRLTDDWRRADEAKQRETELEARHSDLQQLRALKDEQDRVKAEVKELQDRAQAEEERKWGEEERMRREEVKRQLAQHEVQQREELEKVQRIIATDKKREGEEKGEERRMHAARFAARQQLEDEKHRQQQQDAARQVEELRERERRLDALRQSVAPQVAIDRQRVQAPTVSSMAERDADGRLFRVDGWSDEAVFSDPRAKLSAALHAAGVAISGDYAREVISSMGAGREARRDARSSEQLLRG